MCTDTVLLTSLDRAPCLEDSMFDGLWSVGFVLADGQWKPGAILKLWADLRSKVGVIEAKKKDGVKFKVRANEDLVDKVGPAANELGILIYPHEAVGKGHVVEDGTLAETTVVIIAQAVEDGSFLVFEGFGLGADNQDKAGGKAGTYAFKQALVQALLAGGSKDKRNRLPDTDDTDTPIAGGVRPKRQGALSPEAVKAMFEAIGQGDKEAYNVALAEIKKLSPQAQVDLMPVVKAARDRVAA